MFSIYTTKACRWVTFTLLPLTNLLYIWERVAYAFDSCRLLAVREVPIYFEYQAGANLLYESVQVYVVCAAACCCVELQIGRAHV